MALGGKEKSYYGVWAGASGGWICDIRGGEAGETGGWPGDIRRDGYMTLGKGYFILKISNK